MSPTTDKPPAGEVKTASPKTTPTRVEVSKSPVPVPAEAAVVRQVSGPKGINPHIGWTEPGWVHTVHLVSAAKIVLTPDFEPATQADVDKINRAALSLAELAAEQEPKS